MPVLKAAQKKDRKTDLAGLKAAKAATKMTKEQWVKHQVGMKEAWPAPSYMAVPHPEGKGHTCYRDETFENVTRWMAETKISYRPHAKAPGSKSHVRYEHYSKAKTVGQALALGSWPGDWCWDFERGYIKVQGPVRDEPIDISNTTQDQDKNFTDVDRAVYAWYRRELAKKLGLTIEQLYSDKGSQESTIMRAHRLVAQREAKRVLEAAQVGRRRITDEEVTGVLREWGFARNVARVNVMQENVTWVWSDTLGLLRDRIGDIHLTQSSKRYPEFVQVLSQWLTDRLPEEAKGFKFTSLNVNKDYAAKVHRDGNNFGPSMISAFGSFKGGQLNYYPEDDGKEQDLEKLQVPKVQFELDKGLALFNGNCAHSVEDFEGNRFSVVYFTLGCHAKMKPEDRKALEDMGVTTPSPDEDPFQIIRPPLGRKRAVASPSRPSAGKLPASRYWSKASLSSRAFAPTSQRRAGSGAASREAPGKCSQQGRPAKVKKTALKK